MLRRLKLFLEDLFPCFPGPSRDEASRRYWLEQVRWQDLHPETGGVLDEGHSQQQERE